MEQFNFNPPTGLQDNLVFPGNGNPRADIMIPLNQIREFLNNNIVSRLNAVRKEYVLYLGSLSSGSATLTMPEGISNLDDFDEIHVIGKLAFKDEAQTFYPKHMSTISISMVSQLTFAGFSYIDTYWLKSTIDKATKKITIEYNRKLISGTNAVDTTENTITKIIGIKY